MATESTGLGSRYRSKGSDYSRGFVPLEGEEHPIPFESIVTWSPSFPVNLSLETALGELQRYRRHGGTTGSGRHEYGSFVHRSLTYVGPTEEEKVPSGLLRWTSSRRTTDLFKDHGRHDEVNHVVHGSESYLRETWRYFLIITRRSESIDRK